MLSKKTVVFLAALLVLLLAANELAGRFLAGGGPVGLPPPTLLPNPDGAPFRAAAVTNGSVAVRAVRAADGAWRLDGPDGPRADAAAVELLLDTVARARVFDRVTARQRAARGLTEADYGFAPPRASVSLERPGARAVLVEFGSDAPGGDGVFARVAGSDDVFAVERAALDALPDAADALRDRILFVPPGREAVAVAVRSRSGAAFRLEAAPGGAWNLVSPYRCAAATDAVEPLLRALSLSVAERFVPAREAVDAGLSPDETDLFLSLQLEGEAHDRDFAFGKPDPAAPAFVYVSALADGTCATVDRAVADALRMPLDVLRDRRILPYDREELLSVSFESAAGAFELAREDGPGSPWTIRRPSPQPADPLAAAAFLDALLAMRDVGAGSAPSNAPPALSTVSLSLVPAPPRAAETFVLGLETAEDGSTNLVVDSPSRGLRRLADAVRTPAAASDAVALASLRSKTVLALPEGSVPGADPELAALLADLRAHAVVALFAPDSAAYGLLPPRAERTIRTTLPERPVVILQFGSELPDGGTYLRVKGSDAVFEIGPDEAAILAAPPPDSATQKETKP